MTTKTLKIPIKDCVIVKRGLKPVVLKVDNFDNSVPYLSISALETGVVKEYTYPELANICSEEDILVVWDGTRSGLSLKGKRGAIGSTIVALTPVLFDSDYLFYFLKSQYDFINNNTTGSGIPHVNSEIFFAIEIPFASIEVQKDVVKQLKNKLDQNKTILLQQEKVVRQFLSKTKKLETSDEDVQSALLHFKSIVLQDAFTGKLTQEWRLKSPNKSVAIVNGDFEINETFRKSDEIPKFWSWNALGNIAICNRGRFSARPRNDPRFFNGEYPFIQIGDINENGGVINSHKQTLNEDGIKVSKLFKAGTIVIAIVGTSIGNSGVLNYDMYFTDSIVGISVNKDFDNEFIAYYLISEKNNFKSLSYSSGGQSNLKIEYINNYPVPCPPIEEQKEIVKKIKNLLHSFDKIQEQHKAALLHFGNLEKAIISEAYENVLSDLSKEQILKKLQSERNNIETERKIEQKAQMQNKANMKRMFTEASELDIEDVLRLKNREMSAKDVWDQSKYKGNIDAFYEASKQKHFKTIDWKIINEKSGVPESVLILKNVEDEN